MRCSRGKLAAAALLLLSVGEASAAWGRLELFDVASGRGFSKVSFLDAAVLGERYGFGVGTNVLEGRAHGWDIRRRGAPDASAHLLWSVFPVSAWWTLWDWEGPENFRGLDFAEPSVGHVSAFYIYSGWAQLGGFNEVNRSIPDMETRQAVEGSVPATYTDCGLRVDYGNYVAVSAGRFRFTTEDKGVFRSRTVTQTYFLVHLYLAFHKHPERQGGGLMLLRDAYDRVRSLFRCHGWRCNVED